MNFIHEAALIFQNPHVLHVLIILSSFLFTFIRILGKDFYWVIDDLEGIARFSESWQSEEVKDGKVVREEKKIDSYDVDTGKKDKDNKPITRNVKFLSFIPELGFPGNILRFIRLQIGKKFCVLGTNKKGHPIYGFRQSPRRHHILSMFVQAINLVLAYTFLNRILGSSIAFSSCLLYSVYPLTTWSVAWISGINYSLSLMFTLISLNLTGLAFIPTILLVMLMAFLSSICLYVGAFTWTIFLILGMPWHALAYLAVGLIVLLWKGIETKNYRVNNFKEQSMEITTKLHLRKIIVAFKTFAYYISMVFLPIKMGLYHIWGYHYDESLERFDGKFWSGFLLFCACTYLLFYSPFPVRFGIVWFISYWLIFCNLVTAMQFVSDRYAVIPSFGICIILSFFLQSTPFYWILFGLYVMRTFLFLPTFKNEIDFYLSNWLNFRKSEVALGNLGVAYINQGMPGAAVDTWTLSTRLNPLYDVPWYNLYSVFRGNGRLQEAWQFINNCLNAKVVHFKDRWVQEREELKKIMEGQQLTPKVENQTQQVFMDSACQAFNAKDPKTELYCLQEFLKQGTDGILPEMLDKVQKRIEELEKFNADQLHHSSQGS